MNEELLKHYYGDEVRVLFIVSGLIMIISYPFFSSLIGVPLAIAIIASVVLAIFSGLMNPRQKWVVVLNTIISVTAFIVFEYSAAHTYLTLSPVNKVNIAFFWANQALAIIFFFAAYLSTKTLRGRVLADKNEKTK